MVNILFLTRLRAATEPIQQHMFGIWRFNAKALSSGISKVFPGLQAADTEIRGRISSCAENSPNGVGVIKSSHSGSKPLGLIPNLIVQASAWNDLNAKRQTNALMKGPIGHCGHAIFTYFNRKLLPLYLKCCGLQMVPVRHFRTEYVTDSRGITFPCVLSEADQELVRIEANKLLDSKLKKLKITTPAKVEHKKDFKDKGLFGTALHVLAEKDVRDGLISPNLPIPYIFQWMMRYIYENTKEAEDVFERPEVVKRVPKLKVVLENQFRANPKEFKLTKDYDVYDVAASLKTLINELEVPLISSDVYHSFPNIPQEEIYYRTNKTVLPIFILTMKRENRDTLQMLITLFNSTQPYRKKNATLSKIFGPLLFRKPVENPKLEPWFQTLTYDAIVANDGMFAVPHSIMKEIRQHRVDNKIDAKPIHFERKNNLPPRLMIDMTGKCLEVCLVEKKEAKILVNAPAFLWSNKFPITTETTAEDIVSKISDGTRSVGDYINDIKAEVLAPKDPQASDDKDALHLYEVGGNIDERCLHPITNMLELYKANPNAEYWIKSWRKSGPNIKN